ncbi:hypothetical protein LMG28614_02830 [Paraburkholderia ultramafica]|uniref:DUF4214 domain-containing protein n=1 Tax=Paraburkholderia ultramafica TaxID=1544867 RepID=A0A6S7B678_9BURK|nr:DUF4214 domain-containing protein [Paraburkholderia ultramafica]CAB3789239.1 hypothetical protein LMG28614_02830 [Paraburkholderia ultramafica]
MSSNPFAGAAFDLSSLLSTDDIQFIESSYFTLLKRAPDIDGMNYYLARLRNGAPKIQILAQLSNSGEARATGVDLPGLKEAIRIYELTRFPIVGRLLRPVFRLDSGAKSTFVSQYANGKSTAKGIFTRAKYSPEQKRETSVAQQGTTAPAAALELDNSLKELLGKSSEVFWAGDRPPLGWMKSSSRIYNPKSDFRLPAEFHQSFDVVYLTERDLGSIKAWPLVVDEALRLLAPGGKLLIRMSNTALLTIFELKNLIAEWGDTKIVFEHTYDAGSCLFAVVNTRTIRRTNDLAGFSFGVVTDGKRPELLRAFIESVENVERVAGQTVECIVCGPESLKTDLGETYKHVTFVRQPDEFPTLGWITKKKNQIVDAATTENLVIAHDRYTIPSDFIKNLSAYGSDYSVLVCRQSRPDGRRMPDWVTLGGEWSLTSPATLEYGDWSRHVFINGGIMIAKAEVLKRVRWNELLFWGQAEDVELTRRLRAAGYVARLARNVHVISTTMRKGLMDGFEAMPVVGDKHMVPGGGNPTAEQTTPAVGFGRKVNFGGKWGQKAVQMGVYVDSAWEVNVEAIVLTAETYGEITFKLPVTPTDAILVQIEVEDTQVLPTILANDVPATVTPMSGTLLRVELPREVFLTNNILRMHFLVPRDEMKLRHILVEPPPIVRTPQAEGKQLFSSGGTGIAALGSGWSQPEPWGCWMLGDEAQLVLHSNYPGCDLVVEGYAKGFVRPPASRTVISVTVNGMAVGHFALNASFDDQPFHFSVPKELLNRTAVLRISFTPQDPCSPQEIGMGSDPRLLSLGLVSLEVFKKS